jgi:hypothetical protein
MDMSVLINVELITMTTRLPTDGEKPKQYLKEKTKAKNILDEIKEKYGVERGNRGIKINKMNNPTK